MQAAEVRGHLAAAAATARTYCASSTLRSTSGPTLSEKFETGFHSTDVEIAL